MPIHSARRTKSNFPRVAAANWPLIIVRTSCGALFCQRPPAGTPLLPALEDLAGIDPHPAHHAPCGSCCRSLRDQRFGCSLLRQRDPQRVVLLLRAFTLWPVSISPLMIILRPSTTRCSSVMQRLHLSSTASPRPYTLASTTSALRAAATLRPATSFAPISSASTTPPLLSIDH